MFFNSKIDFNQNTTLEILETLNNDDLLVYSPTTINKIGYKIKNINTLNSREIGIQKDRIIKFTNNQRFKRVIGLGNGKTTDIAKYIAFKTGANLIAIPSILSTNVFATDKVCLIENSAKVTLQGKIPDTIVVDYDILSKSDYQYHLYGLCDVLSIHTALKDWELSQINGESKIDPLTYSLSKNILDQLVTNLDLIKSGGEEATKLLFKLILLSGYVTNIYGSGRPESASEHIFSKQLENMIEVPHGISVSLGVLIMSTLQKNQEEVIGEVITQLGLLENLKQYGLTQEIVVDAFKKLKARDDRYTILNEYNLEELDHASIVSKIAKKFNIQFA